MGQGRLCPTFNHLTPYQGYHTMSELMSQAINLMIVGMGFVFVFLAILVVVTTVMSKLVNKYAPVPEPVKPMAAPTAAAAPVDAKLLAVLSEAVNKYREDHKR